jgi:hypothetical protein
MIDANRKSPEKCAPLPTGQPVIPTQVVSPVATEPATVSPQEAAEAKAEGPTDAGGAAQTGDRQDDGTLPAEGG